MFKNLICAGAILFLHQQSNHLFDIDNGIRVNKQNSEYRTANVVPPYKNISPRELQRTTDIHGLKIIVPDDQLWKDLGNYIVGALKGKWNLTADISIPDSSKFVNGWTGNTLILGNLWNNKQMARLYGMRMSYADEVYPGKGGYQLLTLIDPFGLGGNTIIIGATDIDGAWLGVNRLVEILMEEKDPVIPWLLQVELAKETSDYFIDNNKSPDTVVRDQLIIKANRLLEKLEPVMDSEPIADELLNVLSQIKQYSEYFQLTGNLTFGEIYSRLLKGYALFVNTYPSEAHNQLAARKNMWIQGEKIFQHWTVLEASPLFTPVERCQILSALYLTCEANALDNYLVSAPKTGPRWNHEIFPALSLVGSCNYFEKYHRMTEVIKWKELGDQIFSGNTSYISMDEGSDYLMHVPMINIDYAMATGNLKYINQSLHPSADLQAMLLDNLGTLSGGGDTYPFGMTSAYSMGHSQVMNAASWYYKDPKYNFLLERTLTGPFPGQNMSDLKYPIHLYTVKSTQSERLFSNTYPKIQVQQIEPGVYNDLVRQEKGNIEVDQHDTFHKLTFRSGFGLDDNYLILDGFSAGRHGHQDGNAILNYSANGRLFLIDRDYIQNTPEYHSGLVIVKDGKQLKKPPLAKLEWVSDIEGTSLSRSKIPNYNGTDWERTIISPDGKFFIIYDDIKFNEQGNFMIKNLWQSLGMPQINQNMFRVEQKGVTMLLQSMTASDLRLKDIYGHFIKYWKTVYSYPYAENETVLAEVLEEQRYMPGDKAEFINVLSSHKKDSNAVQARRFNEKTIEIRDGETKWIAIQGTLKSDIFSSNGTLHLLGKNELISASVTNIKLGLNDLHFPVPVFFKMNTLTGNWSTYSLLKDKINYNNLGDPIREGAIDSGVLQWNKPMQQRLEKLVTSGKVKLPVTNFQPVKVTSVKGWKNLYSFNEKVTSSASGDINGDRKDEILLAGITGTIKAIDSQGNEIWTFTAKGRVNEVTVQSTGTRQLIFIATENWYVQVLNTEGKEQWNYKFPDDAAHREYKGNLIGITNVRVAFTNGKNMEPLIIVGTQFRYVYLLDLSGKLKSETALYFYGIEDMEYADFDGDSKEEGIFALEYYYYTLKKDNQLITGKIGGPGWKVVDVLNKQGKDSLPSVILGSKQNEIRLIQFKDKIMELWIQNVGGEVNDIRHGDYNNDGLTEILVGTEGFQFYVLNQAGATIFRKTLKDRVLKTDGFRYQGKPYYLAATAQGWLFKFSEKGKMEQSVQFPQIIVNILALNGNSDPWIALENGDLYKIE